jgi:hypothetical protein
MTPIRHKNGTFYDGTAALNNKHAVVWPDILNKLG